MTDWLCSLLFALLLSLAIFPGQAGEWFAKAERGYFEEIWQNTPPEE